MKFSTLIVNISDITEEKIFYTTKPSKPGVDRVYSHIIPSMSQFPFENLKLGHWYALVSCQPESTWYWWLCYPMTADESSALVDESLTEYLEKL